MIENNEITQNWQQYITIIFVTVYLTQIPVLPVIAQEKIEETKIIEAPIPFSDKLPNITTPTNEVIVDPTMVELSNEIRPKRVKPQEPLYFLAQYIQQYDDNVMSREKATLGNLVFIPQIGFGAIYVRPRNLFRFDYLGGVEIHQHFPEFNGALQSLNIAYEYDLSKKAMFFVNEVFFQSPLVTGLAVSTNPNLDANALTPLIPTRLISNDVTVGVVYQLGRFSDLRTSYSYSLSRFNNPKLINSDEHKLELDYTKRLSRKYSYDILYRNSFFLDKSTQITHTLITSLGYRYKDKLRIRFGLGPQVFLSDIDKRKVFLATLTELSYQATKTTYTVSFTSGIGKGGGLATVTENKAFFGTIAHSFTQKLKAEFGIGYSHARNGFQTTLSPTLISFINNELVINNRLSYLIDNKVEVFFNYTHSNQKGTGTVVRNVNRNIFSIGFRFDTRQKSPNLEKTKANF